MKRGRKSKFLVYKENSLIKKWVAGIYVRLSVEDRDDKEESNSVSNQKQLLNEFIKDNSEIQIYDYYIDDGYSGTNSNRPNFQRLLNDVKNEKINTIIVKDLSRLGRNFIEVGNYIEQIFPLLNVRFIAVNEDIDSYLKPETVKNINVSLKNLINESYSKDLSKKIKTAFETKRKNGEFVGSFAPYGYKKDEKNHNHLIKDEESAKIVKKIFNLAIEGNAVKKITQILNNKRIINPIEYKRKKQNKKCGHTIKEKAKEEIKRCWETRSVLQILNNQVYCGDLLQGRTTYSSYKNHKKIYKEKEEWIIVKNTHEAIIDRETFNKVQEILKSRKRGRREYDKEEKSIFAGYLKCADCKMSMNKSSYKLKNGIKKNSYYCSTYTTRSKKLCTKHYIKEEILKESVLETIKLQINLCIEINKVIQEIQQTDNSKAEKAKMKKQIDKQERELLKRKVLKKSVYEDWKLEKISQKDYQEYVQIYNIETTEIQNKLQILKEQQKEISKDINNNWIKSFVKYKNINEITSEIMESLIDTIYVYENNKISIKFKYEDELKKTLDLLKEKTIQKIHNN